MIYRFTSEMGRGAFELFSKALQEQAKNYVLPDEYFRENEDSNTTLHNDSTLNKTGSSQSNASV